MRRTLPLLLLLFWTPAFAGLGRLTEAEQIEYRVFAAFMTPKQQKQWVHLKTTEERTEALKELRVWDKFYGLDEETRQQVVAGDVAVSWTRDMVYMAWGRPFQKQRLTGREAGRSELLVYRFELDKEGYATPYVEGKRDYKAVGNYQVQLILDDDVVTQLDEQQGWE